jgi:ATP-dependent exoDNAse (exonuclease V) beta subunit
LTVVPPATVATAGEVSQPDDASSVESDFAVLDDLDLPPVSASASVGLGRESRRGRPDDAGSNRLIGTLVHRLLQREPIGSGASDDQLRRTVVLLLAALPVPDVEDVEATLDEVVARVRALSDRDDLRALFLTGRPFHELPFTMQWDGRTLRGTIDCLVESGDGRIVVLEFKTGKPRPEHEAQVAVYRAAAEVLFPESRVETRLVYTSEAPVS